MRKMPDNKDNLSQTKKSSEKSDEIEELKRIIKKKIIQNKALKKIISKLNIEENLYDK